MLPKIKPMKIFAIASIVILNLLSVNVISAQAQSKKTNSRHLTPRQLVSLARQGKFQPQGIPGYSSFLSAVRSEKVDAEKLVASAVVQNKLPSNALQDKSYLKAVEEHLKSGGCSFN